MTIYELVEQLLKLDGSLPVVIPCHLNSFAHHDATDAEEVVLILGQHSRSALVINAECGDGEEE